MGLNSSISFFELNIKQSVHEKIGNPGYLIEFFEILYWFYLTINFTIQSIPALLPTTITKPSRQLNKQEMSNLQAGGFCCDVSPNSRVCLYLLDVVGLLLLAGRTEHGFAYYSNYLRAILSRSCLRGSARLALIKPILKIKVP